MTERQHNWSKQGSFRGRCFGFGCSWQQKRHAADPPPAGVRRRMKRNRQKLVGRYKGSLTEQQTEGTGTTTIQKRGLHRTNPQNRARRTDPRSRTAPPLCPPEPRVRSRRGPPPPRNPTWGHRVWNTRLCLARLGLGQPTRLCPFLDSGEN